MKEHGLTRVARLASNENPDPPSQDVIKEGPVCFPGRTGIRMKTSGPSSMRS